VHNWFVVGCSVGSCSHSSHACDFKLWMEFLIVWLSRLLDCLTAFQFVIHFQNSLSQCSCLVFVLATLKDVWREFYLQQYVQKSEILQVWICTVYSNSTIQGATMGSAGSAFCQPATILQNFMECLTL
jgi:hypothetical protein